MHPGHQAYYQHGEQITAQTAPKHSSALASASTTPLPPFLLLKKSTILTSQIPRCVVQSMSNASLAISLAQDLLLTDGQACYYECTLKVPDSLVLHMVRHQGKYIAKCQVYAPQKQKTGNAVLEVAPPALSPSTSKPPTQQN
ncbi:hypothetical protein C0995_004543 [Termitomyces sp. Mi166|nr:hypothetical protein C0995_004543 [Termitomyces sp. Mi166\